ncbi:MAG TPA: ARMT1-like domain-containing protein, partial [Opitutaceae bacterium]|nr:ARMT1-like domain-containing protein [Opitutaceae bacterium]
MHIQLDCLPCFLRQTLEAARQATNDEELQRSVMLQVCRALHFIDARRPPPAMAQQVHRIIRATLGDDPYRNLKDRMNRLGLALLRRLRRAVQAAGNPFDAAARVATAANCIDFGARSPGPLSHLVRFVESSLQMPARG